MVEGVRLLTKSVAFSWVHLKLKRFSMSGNSIHYGATVREVNVFVCESMRNKKPKGLAWESLCKGWNGSGLVGVIVGG